MVSITIQAGNLCYLQLQEPRNAARPAIVFYCFSSADLVIALNDYSRSGPKVAVANIDPEDEAQGRFPLASADGIRVSRSSEPRRCPRCPSQPFGSAMSTPSATCRASREDPDMPPGSQPMNYIFARHVLAARLSKRRLMARLKWQSA